MCIYVCIQFSTNENSHMHKLTIRMLLFGKYLYTDKYLHKIHKNKTYCTFVCAMHWLNIYYIE